MKLPIEQILVLVDLLPHLLPFSSSPDLCKQPVFLHDTQDGLGIIVDASFLQHQPHPPIAIRAETVLSLFCDDFCKNSVFLRSVQTMDEIIVSTSGYLKEATHNGYRIFVSVTVDYGIFCSWPHFLPVECRKSRNNSFSILSRLFSYLYSASVFAGLRPRVFGRTGSFSQHCIAHRLIPYSRLSAFWLSPARIRDTTSSRIPSGYFFIPFFPDIPKPPNVVLFSYTRGPFVYCPFLLVRFIRGTAFAFV